MVALLWSLLLSSCLSSVGALSLRGRENPIRRIVTLLQDTQKETEAEGEKEEEAFEKFMCYCPRVIKSSRWNDQRERERVQVIYIKIS